MKITLNKKAGVISPFILSVVLVVIGFVLVIAAFALFFGNFESEIDKEVCQQSVVYRSTFNAGPVEVGKEIIPLKCKTEKICITGSDEKCINEFGEENNNNLVTYVELDEDKEIAKIQILDVISQSLYDCNWMMGGGKLNFLPTKNFEYDYCVICSRIAFDSKTREMFPNGVGYLELYENMENKIASSGKSYLEEVYGVSSVDEIEVALLFAEERVKSGEFKDVDASEEELKAVSLDTGDWRIEFNKEQAIMVKMITQGKIKAKLAGVSSGGLIMTIGGVALLIPGVGPFIGSAIIAFSAQGGVLAGGATYISQFPDGLAYYQAPMIFSYDSESILSEGCDSFENLT